MTTSSSSPSDIKQVLLAKLQTSGLAGRPGKLLYSGLSTLKPSLLYLLGFNPGGDSAIESGSIESHLLNSPTDWNEYLDAQWRLGSRVLPPGTAPLQKRVRYLLEGLGFDPRAIPASNIVFVRARSVAMTDDAKTVGAKCWDIHSFFVDIVLPRTIIAMGSNAREFISYMASSSSALQSFPSGHGDWMCTAEKVMLNGRKIMLITLPHLSRYAIDRHPDVIFWMRKLLETRAH